MGTRFFF